MRRIFIMLLLAGAIVPLAGCSQSNESHPATHAVSMLPGNIQGAADNVRLAYQYAVDHPDELAKYPCYCGCGPLGHTSNLSCYVTKVKPDGQIVFDMHATSCTTCIDITTDVMRMKADGIQSLEIRAYIDETYSWVGPGTDTPLPLS